MRAAKNAAGWRCNARVARLFRVPGTFLAGGTFDETNRVVAQGLSDIMEKPAKGRETSGRGTLGRGKMQANPRAATSGHGAEPGKEDWIGRQLRRVYDEAATEPLPDDLKALLEQLDHPSEKPGS